MKLLWCPTDINVGTLPNSLLVLIPQKSWWIYSTLANIFLQVTLRLKAFTFQENKCLIQKSHVNVVKGQIWTSFTLQKCRAEVAQSCSVNILRKSRNLEKINNSSLNSTFFSSLNTKPEKQRRLAKHLFTLTTNLWVTNWEHCVTVRNKCFMFISRNPMKRSKTSRITYRSLSVWQRVSEQLCQNQLISIRGIFSWFLVADPGLLIEDSWACLLHKRAHSLNLAVAVFKMVKNMELDESLRISNST